MYDPTLHAKTIERQFVASDFEPKRWGVSRDEREAIVQDAMRIAVSGFSRLSLRRTKIAGKPVYRQSSLSEALLLRHVAEGIQRITKVQQSDRNAIIKSLTALFSEGCAYSLVKIDIKSFYESIQRHLISAEVEADAAYPRQSVKILKSYFDALARNNIDGLPRGLGLSATLSEYLMRRFDEAIRRMPGVRYYNRFVDDGIVVLSAGTNANNFLDTLQNSLPNGLVLNRKKSKIYQFTPFAKGNRTDTEHIVNFLGYEMNISYAVRKDGAFARNVRVDISASKVSKIKRKLCLALRRFNQDSDFPLLYDRIRLLTSNYGFIDRSTGQTRYSGLRYNYPAIDLDQSESIRSLDTFLVNAISSKHAGNRVRPSIDRLQHKKLIGLGFKTGFQNNRFFHFNDERLKLLLQCWVNA